MRSTHAALTLSFQKRNHQDASRPGGEALPICRDYAEDFWVVKVLCSIYRLQSAVCVTQKFKACLPSHCSQGKMFMVSWEFHLPGTRENSGQDRCPAWVISAIPERGKMPWVMAPADGQNRWALLCHGGSPAAGTSWNQGCVVTLWWLMEPRRPWGHQWTSWNQESVVTLWNSRDLCWQYRTSWNQKSIVTDQGLTKPKKALWHHGGPMDSNLHCDSTETDGTKGPLWHCKASGNQRSQGVQRSQTFFAVFCLGDEEPPWWHLGLGTHLRSVSVFRKCVCLGKVRSFRLLPKKPRVFARAQPLLQAKQVPG